jgi:hypothetical protein
MGRRCGPRFGRAAGLGSGVVAVRPCGGVLGWSSAGPREGGRCSGKPAGKRDPPRRAASSCIGGGRARSKGPAGRASPCSSCSATPGESVGGDAGQVGELVELVAGHGEQRIVRCAHAVCPLAGVVGEAGRDALV